MRLSANTAIAAISAKKIIPAALLPQNRPVQVVEPAFHLNYTSFLNVIFLVVFAGIFYLYKNRLQVPTTAAGCSTSARTAATTASSPPQIVSPDPAPALRG